MSDKKEWPCDKCGKATLVPSDYEPEGCCGGHDCGCMGRQINPAFCEECWATYFKKSTTKKGNGKC